MRDAWQFYKVKEQCEIYYGRHTAFEIVPWALYSTAILTQGQEAPLQFFADAMNAEKTEQWTNMHIIGMLPNPQTFMIERIKIFGISSATALYLFGLQIGAKIYARRPAWLTSVRPGFECNPGMWIAPQQSFRADLRWQGPADLGNGYSGRPIRQRPVQLALIGQLVRPVQ